MSGGMAQLLADKNIPVNCVPRAHLNATSSFDHTAGKR
jgi:hypothetical protein